MASSVKRKRPSAEDSFITLNQQPQTGNSTIITINQQNQSGDSIITVNQTGDSIVTVKHEHQTGVSFITVNNNNKQQHPTREDNKDSFITVRVESGFEVLNPYFRIRPDEPLQRLKMSWKEREGIAEYRRCYFVYNWSMIDDEDNKTANDVGLKDGDSIDIVLALTDADYD
ncbi:hypothetical protein OSB04_017339 [Centaurea solstitialis]|uniref:Ubiquitin-like domain-containing protein n=1 Tax=Centaurea solstitialis TaxID=347529 RepID=A0AA38WKM1_9ASTR|nr:hypothetical protein OSB04_017339 [Centaurea solstitialis]